MRSTLGVAAGNYYFAAGIVAPDAAKHGSGVVLGGRRDGARIQDDPFSRGWVFSPREAMPFELVLNGSAVRLGGAAAEIFYEVTRHRTILTYISGY